MSHESNENVHHVTELMGSYFDSIFWQYVGIEPGADSARVRAKIGLERPPMAGASLSDISRNLRNLGGLECLSTYLLTARRYRKETQRKELLSLAPDAFDLWRQNYAFFGLHQMVDRISLLEKEFDALINNGIDKKIKLLNHGVCGGLVRAQFLTYFYRLHFLLKVSADEIDRTPILRRAINGYKFKTHLDAHEWWAGFIWATAATAMHDLADRLLISGEKLHPHDDPLTFLGVLVDELQHWDRYAVHRHENNKVPLESQDFLVEAGKMDA